MEYKKNLGRFRARKQRRQVGKGFNPVRSNIRTYFSLIERVRIQFESGNKLDEHNGGHLRGFSKDYWIWERRTHAMHPPLFTRPLPGRGIAGKRRRLASGNAVHTKRCT